MGNLAVLEVTRNYFTTISQNWKRFFKLYKILFTENITNLSVGGKITHATNLLCNTDPLFTGNRCLLRIFRDILEI